MAVVVLDSSVLLGLLDPDDVHHTAAAQAVRDRRTRGHTFVVSAVVLAEVLVGAARRGAAERQRRREQIVWTFGSIRVVDEAVADRAAQLRAEHPSLRLPDALVLAVGAVDEAAEILTCDQRWPRFASRVVVLR